jgi:hypothetical protein
MNRQRTPLGWRGITLRGRERNRPRVEAKRSGKRRKEAQMEGKPEYSAKI